MVNPATSASDINVSSEFSAINSDIRYNPIPIIRVDGLNNSQRDSGKKCKKNKVKVREVQLIPASEALKLPWLLEGNSTSRGQPPVAEPVVADVNPAVLEVEEAPTITVEVEEEAATTDADAAEIARIAAELERDANIAAAAAAERATIAREIAEAAKLFAEVEEMDIADYDHPIVYEDYRKIKKREEQKKQQQKVKEQERQKQQKMKEQQLKDEIRATRRKLAKLEKELCLLHRTNKERENRRAEAARKSAEYRARRMNEARSQPREFRGLEPAPSSSSSSSESGVRSDSSSSSTHRGEYLDTIVASLSDEEWNLNMRPPTRFEQLAMEQLMSLDHDNETPGHETYSQLVFREN